MNSISEIAKKLLDENRVSAVVGYSIGSLPNKTKTVIVKSSQQAEKLIFNNLCVNNLAIYLTKSFRLTTQKPVAVVMKGCDVKSVTGLIQEKQIEREQVFIIGVKCNGVSEDGKNLSPKCYSCKLQTPKMYDILVGEEEEKNIEFKNPFSDVEEFEKKSLDERWNFWMNELEKCVKCYACRQVCPLCYCEKCIVDKTVPRWIEPHTSKSSNLSWHITRAFHLAGRCTGCGECERACHHNIPLSLLNKKMAKVVYDNFNYQAGLDDKAKSPLADFKFQDKEDFIR
ncbi:MAG: Fe-S oxidoreductase [Chlorobiaceae bacterium]|nr:Fe-S oxidoreductase [Chlorobiaceae bacterium]